VGLSPLQLAKNREGLKLNGTLEFLGYAGGLNLLGNNINIIKRNTDAVVDDSKEVDIEVNTQNTKYFMN
jgi:hypothetical protein